MRSASANTASMSCSISRMVSSCLSTRSMRGRVASAMAISSWRCSPWLRLATSTSAREPRPTRSSAARAGARSSGSRRALRQKRNEWPACACTASATLSSVEKSRNSEVTWNERASPSWLRRYTGTAVMSAPSKRMRPALGASSPVSWAISVVFPAPLGPMTACSSLRGTSSEMASEATTPPKRLVRASICSSGSATAHLRIRPAAEPRPQGRRLEQAVDAATREQHYQQQQRTQNDLPVFGKTRERLLEHQQRHRADQRPERGAHAAEHHHDDQVAGPRPVHHGRADEVGVVGEQRAGKAAQGSGDDEAGQAVAEGREADRLH